jgi:hypothetical protein
MLDRQDVGYGFSRMNLRMGRAILCLAACGLLASNARAIHIYTISDGNASVGVDVGSQGGLDSWSVDGRNQLSQEGLWYQIGNAPHPSSITTIGNATVTRTADTLTETFQNTQLRIQVLYSLTGGSFGSGTASVSEQLSIQNLTRHAFDFQLFEYAEFEMAGTARFGTGAQGLFDDASVTGYDGSIAEDIDAQINPGANQAASGHAAIDRLADACPAWLDGCGGGSTNASWALEWDRALAAGGTVTITNFMNVAPVPEPSALCLALLGLAICSRSIRRR